MRQLRVARRTLLLSEGYLHGCQTQPVLQTPKVKGRNVQILIGCIKVFLPAHYGFPTAIHQHLQTQGDSIHLQTLAK